MSESLLFPFPLAGVLVLAEHAFAAPEHRECPATGTGGPCLVWVKGDGTHLVSNGLPHLSGRGTGICVVHADCWEPGTGNGLGDTTAGGEDLSEYLPLTEPFSDGRPTTFLEDLRAAADQGRRQMVLKISEGGVDLAFND
ncbi:hypothetical protein ACFVZ3_09060 [Kitasatospora purpeofusca]|uniref:hypothetical protein n=1 Tax=Kitasatospora purpeofusca TaxID=67352 RepID=UPI0036A20A1B